MRQDEFTYPQPWWVEGRSWLFLFTRYTNGRELYWSTSPDGRTWAPAQRLATGGHYQMSNERDGRVITGFNAHPDAWNVDARTNLYFLQTADGGRTWATADGINHAPNKRGFIRTRILNPSPVRP